MIECNDKPFVTRELVIQQNGRYSTIGYDQADVDVKSGGASVLVPLEVSKNGIYRPEGSIDGYNEVTVNVPDKPEQEKTADIQSNGTQTVTPDEGYALSKVTVNVNVPSDTPAQEKTFTNVQTTGTFFVEPDPGYLLSKVTINITPSFSLYGTGYDDTYNIWLECAIGESIQWAMNELGDGTLYGDCTSRYYYKTDIPIIILPNFDMRGVTCADSIFGYNKSLILAPNDCDFTNCLSANRAFSDCSALQKINRLGLASYCESMFESCLELRKIDKIYNSDSGHPFMNAYNMFGSCVKLQSIPVFDCSKLETFDYMFSGCYELENTGGFTGLGATFEETKTFDLSSSQALSEQSIQNILDTVYDMVSGGKTAENIHGILKLSSDVYAKVTDEQKQQATIKGWIIETS